MRAVVILTLVVTSMSAAGFAETHTVKPGDDVQAVVDAAASGDTVVLSPGLYENPIAIATPGVSVEGAIDNGERAVLDMGGAHLEAIRVSADDVRVSGFVVRGAMATGIVAYRVQNVSIENVIVESNSFIGINAAETTGLTVRNCVLNGHASAGILLAQSSQATLIGNQCFDNLTGVRIENSDNFVVENNTVYRNATGIALLTLPGRSRPLTTYGRLLYNRMLDNNAANHADPGGIDAAMIPGVGIYVVGADHIEIGRGRFDNNRTYAVLTVSLENSSLPDTDGVEDGITDHLYVHHNAYRNNGVEASAEFEQAFPDQPAGDLYWDSQGERNQFQETGEFRTVPDDLVQQQGGAHTNVIHFL